MTSPDLYIYSASVLRWVDGDTVDVAVDLGFRIAWRIRLRLVGPDGRYFDAWETKGSERERGILAWDFARDFAPEGSTVHIRTYKDSQGKYGRWLAQVLHADTGDDLAQHMVAAGHGEWGP